MKKCKNCGSDLEEHARFCINCGTKVEIVPDPILPPKEESQVQEPAPIQIPQQPQAEPSYTTNENGTLNIDDQIIVPKEAHLEVNTQTYQATPSLQKMPELSNNDPEGMMDSSTTTTNNNQIKKVKKRKTKLNGVKIIYIIAGIAGGIFVIVVCGLLVAFGMDSFEKMGLGNGGKEEVEKLDLNENNSFRVGSKDYGYVSVPNSWIPFGLTPENQTIQYTDGTGWIVTLYSIDTEKANPKAWAASIINQMNNEGASEVGYEETTINSWEGYKVFGYYGSAAKYLAAWVVDGDDGKSHYIAIEGPDRYNLFYDIIYTFNTLK